MHCRLSIEAATVGDTTEYVDHRLRRAGADKMLLGSDALTLLHEATACQLRDIDRPQLAKAQGGCTPGTF